MKTMTIDQLVEASGKVMYILKRDMYLMDFAVVQKWIDNSKRRIVLVVDDEVPTEDRPAAAPFAKRLLEFVTSTKLPKLPRFVAADHFKEDTKGAVRIWFLGDNFKTKFFGKIENATAATDLKVQKLLEESHDPAIMTELGDACGITLGQFFHLLSKQGKGETGPLLVNGWANVAYIKDTDGVFWAVCAYWCVAHDGWGVEAYSIRSPYGWRDGRRFLSR